MHIDYCWLRNCWWKLNPCCPKNHPRNPLLRLTLKFLKHIDYCWLRNRWWKLGPCAPKNHPRCPVLRPTLTSSVHIEYWWLRKHWWKWALSVPKIILETQFHGWRWNLQWIETAADSKTIDKNSVPADQKIIQEPSSTADTHIYSAYRLTLTEKTLT